MIRPVILSRPEKVAFLFTIFCAGGSLTTSSPGCKVAGVCGTAPFGGTAALCGAPFCGFPLVDGRCPGGTPGVGAAPGGTAATGGLFCGTTVVPGGGASGCHCTGPGSAAPCPGGSGRVGAVSTRPCGSSGTSSSSSGGGSGSPRRGILPGGRGTGSEKI